MTKEYDENGKPNAMNAAWGGISEETQISICVDDGHKTAKNVVQKLGQSIEEQENRYTKLNKESKLFGTRETNT